MPNDDDVPICRSCETSRLPTAQPGDPAYPAPADPWAPKVEEIIPIPAPPTEPLPAAPFPNSSAPTEPGFAPSESGRAPSEAGFAPSEPGFAPSEPGFAPSESAPARTAATQPAPFGTTPLGPGPAGPIPIEPRPLGPAPSDGGPRPTRWILPVALVFVVVVVVAAVVVVPRLLGDRNDQAGGGSPTAAPVTTIDTPEPTTPGPTDTVTTQPTTTAPTTVSGGIVVVGPSVTDDRATSVAAMFDTYFGGINGKDYNSVGSVLDPAGAVNPHSASDMADLAEGTRSTTDSNVVLTSLSGASGGLLSAEVTFQSKQNAGDGPRGRPGETCTRWDIRYTVTSAYRIRKSKAASQPC